MSKYDRDSRDVYAVKRLGDEIGFGHLMTIAHEVWARELEEKGLPREGAYCAVGRSMVKEEYVEDAVTDPIYKGIVERALADTPQTDCPCNTCANKGDHDGECQNCVADSAPIRWETPSHYKPKQMDTSQTDCPWK